jgi:hypothetical protein
MTTRPALVLLLTCLLPSGLEAQDSARASAAVPQRLRLFLDCATHCDRQYLRSEITTVDWVTDREASDVYLLATSLRTGSGGNEVALEFIGRGTLDGMTDRHTFQTAPDATLDEFRGEFARVVRLGLVRYLLAAGQGRRLVVASLDGDGDAVEPGPTDDPWNLWVFNVQLDGEFDAESRRKGTEVNLEFNANRVSDDWKVDFEIGSTIDRTEFELDDGSTFTATRDRWRTELLVVRSLGPQLSLGFAGEARGAKPDNLDLRLRLAPAIEVDLFPYAEAHRRRMILQYTFGFNHYDYVEETIFGEVEETRFDHRFRVAYRTRQPWGDSYLTGTFETFAHDWSLNRLGLSAGIDVRLAKGLGLEIDANYSKVKNQITIPKGDASDEEIFLELRELQTDYKLGLSIGLSYTFGSFLNSIVNPRFDNLN